LFGSVINIIIYLIYTFSRIYSLTNNLTEGKSVEIGGLMEIIIKMTNSIYMGFEAILYTENVLMRTPPYYFFLTLIPLYIVGIGAYYLGASEISIMRKLGFKPKHKTTNKRRNKN